jgi:hypothetical protein
MLRSVRRFITTFLLVASFCAFLGVSAGAAGAKLNWTGAIKLDVTGGVALAKVACVPGSECVGLDAQGRYVRFDPATGAASSPVVLASGGIATGVACPLAGDCIALFQDGHAVAFDPETGSAATPIEVDAEATVSAAQGAHGLACPDAGECVAVDGDGAVVVFNPGDPAAATAPVKVDAGEDFGLVAVTCESATQCTAISQTKAIDFDPQTLSSAATGTAAGPQAATVAPKGLLSALACPAGDQCTAVDSLGREVSFDPQTLAATPPVSLDSEQINPLTDISCPAATSCVAVSEGGRLLDFNPGAVATVGVSNAIVLTGTGGLTSVACTSPTACTAVDTNGQAAQFSLSSMSAPTLKRVDSGTALDALACASATQCTAADRSHELTFDPLRVSRGAFTGLRRGSLGDIGALACPRTDLCTATSVGRALAFDPQRFRPPSARKIDAHGDVNIVAVRCRGASDCVAIDTDGGAVIYNGATGRLLRKQLINVDNDEALTALACPTKTQCTALDNDGTMITFRPLTGKRVARARIDAKVGLDAPSGGSSNELDGLACVSSTRCVAIDTLGDAVSFDPRTGHAVTPRVIDASHALTAIACPLAGACVATDDAGRLLTGNLASGTWSAQQLHGASALTAITCSGATECVAVDAAGAAFVGHS